MILKSQILKWRRSKGDERNALFQALYEDIFKPIIVNVSKRYSRYTDDNKQECALAIFESLLTLKLTDEIMNQFSAVVAQICKWKTIEGIIIERQKRKRPINPISSYNLPCTDNLDYIDTFPSKHIETDIEINEIVNKSGLTYEEKKLFDSMMAGEEASKDNHEVLNIIRDKIYNNMDMKECMTQDYDVLWRNRYGVYKVVYHDVIIAYIYRRSDAAKLFERFVADNYSITKYHKAAVKQLKEIKYGCTNICNKPIR